MSHIGKQPIVLPPGAKAEIKDGVITLTGGKGNLHFRWHPAVTVVVADGVITCRLDKPNKKTMALWGTTRARIANMVTGVTAGFQRQLEMHGVGYRAAVKGKNLELSVGFSHPVTIEAGEGITFMVAKELITVSGIDKEQVGQVAATIRAVRPPEPYKGKGIHYLGEHIRRKVGKVVGATAA